MNYKKYIKKREQLINELKESFQSNVNPLGFKFEIKDIVFTSIYKEDNIILIIYKSEKFDSYFLDLYIYIDYINLDIKKTMFDYSLYKKENNIEIFFKQRREYNELDGQDLREKMITLKNIINQHIDGVLNKKQNNKKQ